MTSETKFLLIVPILAVLINGNSTIPQRNNLKANDGDLILTNSILKDSDNSTFTDADVQAIINEIPQEEQSEFLRYHLNYGFLVKDSQQVFKNLSKRLTAAESVKLFNYFVENRKIADENATKILETTVCFPEGCVDIDDSGVHP